jgi:hypothetical protein
MLRVVGHDAAAGFDEDTNTVLCWEVGTAQQRTNRQLPVGALAMSVSSSPKAAVVATGGGDKTLKLWAPPSLCVGAAASQGGGAAAENGGGGAADEAATASGGIGGIDAAVAVELTPAQMRAEKLKAFLALTDDKK